jgi:hypothetical protein
MGIKSWPWIGVGGFWTFGFLAALMLAVVLNRFRMLEIPTYKNYHLNEHVSEVQNEWLY